MKFKPGDRVYYIYDEYDSSWDNSPIDISYVVSYDAARLRYNGQENMCTLETIIEDSKRDHNCNPVFLIDELDSPIAHIGWMPENALFHYTDAARILYGKKD